MEEELGGRQAGQVRVLYKASTLGAVIIFDEVGQCPMLEAEWDSLTLHVLLPYHSNNLHRDVQL